MFPIFSHRRILSGLVAAIILTITLSGCDSQSLKISVPPEEFNNSQKLPLDKLELISSINTLSKAGHSPQEIKKILQARYGLGNNKFHDKSQVSLQSDGWYRIFNSWNPLGYASAHIGNSLLSFNVIKGVYAQQFGTATTADWIAYNLTPGGMEFITTTTLPINSTFSFLLPYSDATIIVIAYGIQFFELDQTTYSID